MPRITHIELNCSLPEKLAAFYKRVFGWIVQKKQEGVEDYWFMISGGNTDSPGINAGMKDRMAPGLMWVPTIHVQDIDKTLEKVTASGGKITHPKRAVTATGFLAYCEDPEGNLFGVLEKDSSVS